MNGFSELTVFTRLISSCYEASWDLGEGTLTPLGLEISCFLDFGEYEQPSLLGVRLCGG